MPIAATIVTSLVVLGGGLAIERYLAGDRPVALDQVPTPSASPSASPDVYSGVPSPTSAKTHRARRPHTAHPASPTATTTNSAPSGFRGLAAAAVVVRLTNAQRVRHGCGPLRVDARLARAARAHSADMDHRHYFDHDSRDGRSPWDRIKAAGYPAPGAENIAMGQPTAASVMNAWMNSSGHRANILNCGLKSIGVGVQYDSGGPWWTEDFGWV